MTKLDIPENVGVWSAAKIQRHQCGTCLRNIARLSHVLGVSTEPREWSIGQQSSEVCFARMAAGAHSD